MEDYVLPPQFDFLNNPNVSPIVMYMFEFKYFLDKDDLSYIWQNLAPRNYTEASFQEESTAHALMNTELLTEHNLLANPNLRWMVFKVKQRGQAMYTDMITRQIDQPSNQEQFSRDLSREYPLKFNWPYDYISIVETINFDVDVKYDRMQVKNMKSNALMDIGKQNKALSKKLRAEVPLKLDVKQTGKAPSDKNVKVKAMNKMPQGKKMSTKNEQKAIKTSTTSKKPYGV